ncbi:unnamed protein product [Rotaria magnacalcarata]|uniref:Uncharacterized protein n=1 Tax=Rotaria magnacalcarata TaxID=392030 RepID=A0A818ZLK3_9BILA|nr:unnamed protein product [Rotaria magnacalcarata]CAF2260651.1 unnamed protein product [Rotaria magnacalcarata]CAF3771293.1 unnamed protein product [Rotaria magnacalcarata]CAF3937191.1 unnamed protein product [Rotaria magnacalcarata]
MTDNEHKLSVIESEIFHAIQNSQYKRLALYIRQNYNLNVTSKEGRNGLFYALNIKDSHKRCRMIRYCLDHGINPLQRDNVNGFTILNEAMARQQLDSFQIFFDEIGGEIDWRALDKRGRTTLHQAVELNNLTIIEPLITTMVHYGISVDVVDRNGLTPYLFALKLQLPDMAQLLLRKGHASQQTCDLNTHFSAREWESIGIKENRSIFLKRIQDDMFDAMKKGKINKVNKLKKMYFSTDQLFASGNSRRNSNFTTTTRSGINLKSSLSINEITDRLPHSDIPHTHVNSKKIEKPFRLKSMVPRSLPPMTNLKRHGPSASMNSILDLFQIAQLSS